MDDKIIPFGPGGLTFIGLYLCSLILIGWIGRRAKRDNSLKDFYLGGGTTGFFVLFLTLYATQYSGNTMFGFSGKAYRIGFSWLTCVHFMTAIIVFLLMVIGSILSVREFERLTSESDEREKRREHAARLHYASRHHDRY